MFGPNGGQKGRLQSNKPLGVNNKLQHKHGNNHRNCQAVATTWLHYATDCSREKKAGEPAKCSPNCFLSRNVFLLPLMVFFSIVFLIFCGIATCIARA